MKYLFLLGLLIGCSKYEIGQCGKATVGDQVSFKVKDKTSESYKIYAWNNTPKIGVETWITKDLDNYSIIIKCPKEL